MINLKLIYIGKKNLVVSVVLSFVISCSILSYSSYYQTKIFTPVRDLVYFQDDNKEECKEKFGGYGRKYKHGCFVNPVSVAQKVLPTADKILAGYKPRESEIDELKEALGVLLKHANARAVRGETVLLLPYEFSWPKYGLESGWVSGMAQGHAIEVAVALYRATGDREYINKAVKFGNAFNIDYENGGVVVETSEGPWFEEYAQAGKKPSFALNGHVFALEGLSRLRPYTDSFDSLIQDAIHATRERIGLYDAIFWSRYDLRGTPANQKYHHVHIKQLFWLATEWGVPQFEKYGKKFLWQQMSPASSIYRVSIYPNRFLVFLFFVNFLAVFLLLYLPLVLKTTVRK